MLKEGLYEEIINNSIKKDMEMLGKDMYEVEKGTIDVEEARKLLASYISNVTGKALRHVREGGGDDREALLHQIQTCNDIIGILAERLDDEEFESLKISEEGQVLKSIYSRINSARAVKNVKAPRPVTPLSQSSLFTGSRHEPSMMEEIRKEIISSDSVDIIVSFIKWSGLRCIIEELREFTRNRNGKLRFITTSYMGASDYKAVLELGRLENTSVKVSYDVERTRLHAKAYMFKRDTGFTTAYIGSSNISNPALTSGLEWNVKVTEKDSFDIIKKFEATFESYWNDAEFVRFDAHADCDRQRLRSALKKRIGNEIENTYAGFDITPYLYQKEILEKLQVERSVFGRFKNLIVAATGTGKTVISAFDYKDFRSKSKGSPRLLFVAHREEILRQSMNTFRTILKDQNFGDILAGGYETDSIENLFVSIQSFNSTRLDERTSPDFYDFIIIDEFHHAAAKSYQKLLGHYRPKVLLGLTATPERMDGKNILEYFEDRIASEMRLPEAIDRKLLCPFQYFCVTDNVDLSKLKWSRRGYDIRELENVYTSNKVRSIQILNSIRKYVTEMESVKGIGFCVSVDHAIYMADFFNRQGVPSLAVHGKTDAHTRNDARRRLSSGEIKFIFAVDIYNEGVDIPQINTVLFLRPTESLTVFVQQIGRGLRLFEGKDCLTVLDFVGRAHKNYRFEHKLRALVGRTKNSIKNYVENGFFNLPRGCFIQMEKQAREYILRNLKEGANTRRNLVEKIRYFKSDTGLELTLQNFLDHHNISIYDFYGKSANRTMRRMMADAGIMEDFECEDEEWITRRIPSLFHLNSKKFIDFIIGYMEGKSVKGECERLMLNMFYYSFYRSNPADEGFESVEKGIEKVLENEHMRGEILEVLKYNGERVDLIEIESGLGHECPLKVHCSYSTAQIMAALGYFDEKRSPAFREGVKHFKDEKLDVFFVTLNKSEKEFSPSTLYEDYAISERLFHWQTQSRVSSTSPTAGRYINHKKTGNKIALFAREYKKENGYASSFVFLGECEYVSHSGNRPMSFVWRLKEEMPPSFVSRANKSVL